MFSFPRNIFSFWKFWRNISSYNYLNHHYPDPLHIAYLCTSTTTSSKTMYIILYLYIYTQIECGQLVVGGTASCAPPPRGGNPVPPLALLPGWWRRRRWRWPPDLWLNIQPVILYQFKSHYRCKQRGCAAYSSRHHRYLVSSYLSCQRNFAKILQFLAAKAAI